MDRKARRIAGRQGGRFVGFMPSAPKASLETEVATAIRLFQTGRHQEAEAECRKLLAVHPNQVVLLQILGVICHTKGDHYGAIDSFQRAIRFDPTNADAYNNLGNVLNQLGNYEAAVATLRNAIELNPDLADAHTNLGRALGNVGEFHKGIGFCRKALALNPTLVQAHVHLGQLLWESGAVAEGVECFERATELAPSNQEAWSNLLMTLQYSPEISAEEATAVAAAWGKTRSRRRVGPKPHEMTPTERLRVGYVSGDFRAHPVAYQLESILSGHDPSRVEITCYSNSALSDEVTARLKTHAHHWRDIFGLSDEAAAQLIKQDGIQVLVDLSGHTAHNRLGVFARRPAPVQTTWLGYVATTGLPEMDFILRDAAQIPAEEESLYVERVCTLSDSSFGYAPADDCPEVSPLPALKSGSVTFGCFGNLAKISSDVIDLWSRVLREVPTSSLLLDRKGFDDQDIQDRIRAGFEANGVDGGRIRMSASRGHAAYLKRYEEVDIVLDTFPFNGSTTTYEALWMGAPVVTRSWDRMVGHFGESILGPCGHGDWVARTDDEYVSIAARLANDLPQLAEIRSSLRSDLATSDLCRPFDCARVLEDAFWDMWDTVFEENKPANWIPPELIPKPEPRITDTDLNVLHGKGVQAFGEHDLALSAKYFERMIQVAPEAADGYNNLGVVLRELSKLDEAIASYRKALEFNPNLAGAHANLGSALICSGSSEEALSHLALAIELEPRFAKAWLDLVGVLAHLGRFQEAFQAFEHAAELGPELVLREGGEIYSLLGRSLSLYGQTDEAEICMLAAVKQWNRSIDDGLALFKARNALGLDCLHGGRLDEAVEWFRKASATDPDQTASRSNMFWCLQYSDNPPEIAFQEAVSWAREFTPKSLSRRTEPNREGDRRLRIGYVSPEFREHPVAHSISPLLESHNRSEFEIFLYANTAHPDSMSNYLRSQSDHWRNISRMTDDQAADLIQRDKIDILIDLAGHTENNRIGVFARKPAPVQAQWLGYYATSGMPQMDYIIVNPRLIPSDEEKFYVEKPMRLKGEAFAFELPAYDIEVPPLPAFTNGHVTFGCHNYLAKVTPEVVRVWSEVLKAVPGSRMVMNRHAFVQPATKRRFLDLFAENGIEASRLDLISTQTREEYLKSLGDLDIFLDTFPFNGSTSTYEALWMGLPVVTMSAPRMVGHFSESIVSPLGYESWVARDAETYVAIAARLAADLEGLQEVRSKLRDQFANSPLCDAPAFTLEIETAYRQMWEAALAERDALEA